MKLLMVISKEQLRDFTVEEKFRSECQLGLALTS